MVLNGVSNNGKIEDAKELLDFNKITYIEAECMKSKRSGRDPPFIKIKCDSVKQAKALISRRLVCQKTGGISMPENRHNFQGQRY